MYLEYYEHTLSASDLPRHKYDSKPLHKTQDFNTKKVIFNSPTTIVYWKDGTKTIVRCHDDVFSEEIGFAMACVKKLYGGRSKFKAQFENAQRPYLKPKI